MSIDFQHISYSVAPWEGSAILLVDLDAFFASVEQLDHPAWRGKPVIVGGDADKHGVVSTCSYEARAFGVRSAMPSFTAERLCPQAIWTRGHYGRYREISKTIMALLREETPHVQQVSIDEAFLDITPTSINTEDPIAVAQRIQRRVKAVGVTCSIGLGTSKTIAKIASDMDKPQGLTIVYPGSEISFLSPLPVRKLSGVGAVAEKKLHAKGIKTLGDLMQTDEAYLVKLFGKQGHQMYVRARGLDDSPVVQDDSVKSVSNEVTFAQDLTDRQDVYAAIASISTKVGRRLRNKQLKGVTVALRIKFDDRSVRSVQRQLTEATDDELFFVPVLKSMLPDIWRPGIPIRLIGVNVSGFDGVQSSQTALFETEYGEDDQEIPKPLIVDKDKRRGLLAATDKLKERFGESAVRFGHELRNEENTTGSSAKNIADYK